VTRESIEDFPLALYAGWYWTEHAEFGNVSSHSEDMIKRLFDPQSHHFANWVWIYDTITDLSPGSEAPSRPESAPLHYAARHGFHRVAEWLITTCSQDVNVSGYRLLTPLHIASDYGRLKVVQVLLKQHADVNSGDESGWSPLHFASLPEYHEPEIARLLLEHGAEVDSMTGTGNTPLCLLSDNSINLEVAEILLEYGADPNIRLYGPLYIALQNSHSGLVQLLLKHGADPNARDVDGQTLLHMACRRWNLKIVQGLLELGVDVNSQDSEGMTPLQVASRLEHTEIVQLLSQHGAEGT